MGNFLLGLGLGIVGGLLYAPKSGYETRGMLGAKANEGLDYVKRQSQELRDSAMDVVEKGKDAVNRQVDRMASSQEHSSQVYQR
jgi:gas vesicle protein